MREPILIAPFLANRRETCDELLAKGLLLNAYILPRK